MNLDSTVNALSQEDTESTKERERSRSAEAAQKCPNRWYEQGARYCWEQAELQCGSGLHGGRGQVKRGGSKGQEQLAKRGMYIKKIATIQIVRGEGLKINFVKDDCVGGVERPESRNERGDNKKD